jgi:thiol-disulfide isomerase/thioredoxin
MPVEERQNPRSNLAARETPSESRGSVNRLPLNLSIALTAILVGTLHYKLKPRPDSKEIGMYARSMAGTTEWKEQIAPDFEVKTRNGESFKLSENVGKKIIVLNFFATWCAPCRSEMPELNRYYKEHKGESFLLLGIDAEEKPDRVDEFVSDLKLDFPIGIDSEPIQKQYRVDVFPTTVVIGVDGKVQFYETGALVNAEVAFDNLLKENGQQLKAGHVISKEEYRSRAEKQAALPVRKEGQSDTESSNADEYKFDERGKRIAARMDCPCGCQKKVQICTCNTSKNIKKALSAESFGDQPDDQIMRGLNKRFCMGVM